MGCKAVAEAQERALWPKTGPRGGEREGASRVGTGAAALRYEDSSGPYAKVGALGIRRSVISPAAIICKGEAE